MRGSLARGILLYGELPMRAERRNADPWQRHRFIRVISERRR